MPLPEIIKPYENAAKKLIASGAIGDIEFSGGTYQVQVKDPKFAKDVWAFLQLDGKGQLRDCFCSCEDSEDVAQCVHIAAAYLRIFNGTQTPLHQRFERSLWNQICRIYSDDLGHDESIVKSVGKGQYVITSGRKKVFYIKASNAAAKTHLDDIMVHRKRETEETSLKFSNLTEEEIVLWKEGRPTPELLYELSFWNDLAKWLMFLQDGSGENYSISFDFSTKEIPDFIHIKFSHLECGFYLSEANLSLIIPTLATVNSPLTVHNTDEEFITRVTFDKDKGCLIVHSKELAAKPKKEVSKEVLIGDWLYRAGDGFYPKNLRGLSATPKVCGKEISHVLNENYHTLKTLLEGAQLHKESIPASYLLSFDHDWNLHIVLYVFTPGDLNSPGSHFFGEWVYLDDKGFYHLEELRFEEVKTIIPFDEVGDFVTKNRSWLNAQEGFRTYLSSIEAQLTYQMSDDQRLTFSRRVSLDDSVQNKDFGAWVYIGGQGFYSKVTSSFGIPVKPGLSISGDQIPVFIRANKNDLQLIPGFFSEHSPVKKSGLKVALSEEEQIEVSPIYELQPEYENKHLIFLDDFVYIEGKGFYELSVENRLPEKFRHSVLVEPENIPSFLNVEMEKLKNQLVSIDPKIVAPHSLKLIAEQIAQSGSGYSLKLHYQTERGSISVSDIWSALRERKRFLFSKEGLLDLHQKRFDWLRLLPKKHLDRRSNELQLSTLELIRLNAFDEIEIQKDHLETYQSSSNTLKDLTEFRVPDEPDTKGLVSQLRSYQQQGVNWLWFLYHHHLSGLLCDDMGLGKTHQTMALLAAVINYHKKHSEGVSKHFLVICPTSVIYPWQEKLAKFLPGVRVCTFHGSSRSLGDFKKDYDLLLTSYGIWRNEHTLLSQVPFEIAVLDEIQIAKNHLSRVYQTLQHINANIRIGLTGTPIENHLRELKALFDIVLPGYMPNETDYREFFVKPIEKERNQERRELLSRFIKPFMLRRKKEQVLLDLPEKTEEISHCELSSEQEMLYVNTLNQSRQRLIDDLSNSNSPIPYIHIFALLSHLKQICDHPALFLKKVPEYKELQSGKWELFVELLNEARDSQQKVVVFSQYLGMLDIMEAYLTEHGIEYATIRGSTTNRGEQLQRFNHDPKCEVFIGSLQASGLGIDLTAASVVIHYDRWWNAARENQATDRVHRIGQTRGVQVFKLVTKNTFEEKIDQLITRKGQLMEDVVGVDDHDLLKKFDRQEIIELLQVTP